MGKAGIEPALVAYQTTVQTTRPLARFIHHQNIDNNSSIILFILFSYILISGSART